MDRSPVSQRKLFERELHSIPQAGLVEGGKDRKEGRQTAVLTPLDPSWGRSNDLSRPRNVHYSSKWKPHQDAVCCIHLARAQEKGLQFWQTRSHAIGTLLEKARARIRVRFRSINAHAENFKSGELDTLRKSSNPTTVMTANGEVQTSEEAQVYVHDLDLFVTVHIFDDTPAVPSFGKLCEEHGSACEIKSHI